MESLLLYHFILTSYSLFTQVITVLILIDVQYLQNVGFSFEKGSKGQNHFSSDSQHPIKKYLKRPFPFSPSHILYRYKYIIIHCIIICIYYYLQIYYLLTNIQVSRLFTILLDCRFHRRQRRRGWGRGRGPRIGRR